MSGTRRLTTAQALVEFLANQHSERDGQTQRLEYGNSCMGYEIPGAIGIRMADPGREVFAMVGDAGYLMNPGELVTAVAERVRIIVVLVQNHGYASIGSLSEASGNGRFGTRFRYREADGPVVVHVETDPLAYVTIGGAWWDVAVAEVSDAESVRRARAGYERNKQDQRHYL